MLSNETEYTTVSLPKKTVEKIGKVLEKGNYQNIPDFVRDAIRRRLEELGEVTV